MNITEENAEQPIKSPISFQQIAKIEVNGDLF